MITKVLNFDSSFKETRISKTFLTLANVNGQSFHCPHFQQICWKNLKQLKIWNSFDADIAEFIKFLKFSNSSEKTKLQKFLFDLLFYAWRAFYWYHSQRSIGQNWFWKTSRAFSSIQTRSWVCTNKFSVAWSPNKRP